MAMDLEAVMRLRVAGAPLAVLAQREGVTETELVTRLDAELTAKHTGVPPEYAIELERLDSIQASAWSKMVGGDVKAASVVMNCIESRAKLHARLASKTPTQRLQDALAYARQRAAITIGDDDGETEQPPSA